MLAFLVALAAWLWTPDKRRAELEALYLAVADSDQSRLSDGIAPESPAGWQALQENSMLIDDDDGGGP